MTAQITPSLLENRAIDISSVSDASSSEYAKRFVFLSEDPVKLQIFISQPPIRWGQWVFGVFKD